jgi:hypothetical protein
MEVNSVLKKVLDLKISIAQEQQGKITTEIQNESQEKLNEKFNVELVEPFKPKLTVSQCNPKVTLETSA